MTGDRPLRVVQSMQVWLPLTQTWLHNQIRFLPARIASTVAAERLDGPERWSSQDVQVLRSKPRLPLAGRFMRPGSARESSLRRLARRRRARLLHSHFGNTGWRDVPVARRLRIAHAVSFYGLDLTRYPRQDPAWKGRYRDLLDSGAHVLCEGPHMAGVARSFGGQGARVHVHHLGVDVAALPFRPRTLRPGEPLRILMAASFREKKGLPDALQAVGQLARSRPVEATLVGAAEAGRAASEPVAQRIEAAALDSGLGPRLRRLGFVAHDKLLEEAYAHHVFLSPSRTASDGDTEGGAPIGLIEMAATGMPIVTTRHCDIPHVLPPEYAPLLSAEGDVRGLHAALQRLCDDPGSWSRLAAAARVRIEAEFDAPKQGLRLAGLYDGFAQEA